MTPPTAPSIQMECSSCLRRWDRGSEKPCRCNPLVGMALPLSFILLFAMMGMFMAGCSQHDKVTDEWVNARMTYFQDKRTGLCYAATADRMGAVTCISTVPCEKVGMLLENNWSR